MQEKLIRYIKDLKKRFTKSDEIIKSWKIWIIIFNMTHVSINKK